MSYSPNLNGYEEQKQACDSGPVYYQNQGSEASLPHDKCQPESLKKFATGQRRMFSNDLEQWQNRRCRGLVLSYPTIGMLERLPGLS